MLFLFLACEFLENCKQDAGHEADSRPGEDVLFALIAIQIQPDCCEQNQSDRREEQGKRHKPGDRKA